MKEKLKNPKVILLIGDLGYNFYEEVKELYPDRVINVGIAEQNAVVVAEGLAIAGMKPYVYTGQIFLLRAYEQIRNACYNDLNIKFVGTGASGFLGFSHNLQGKENMKDLFKNLPIKICSNLKFKDERTLILL